MSFCVYKHTSPNGKVYIGITSQNPIKRWRGGRGYKSNSHFTNAIVKYGWDNIKHEILFDGLTKDDACKKEIELIALYKSNLSEYGYNLSSGGESAAYGCIRTEETRKKISEAKSGKYIGEKNPNYGKRWTDEQKKKASLQNSGVNSSWYGRKHTEEQKKKIGESNRRAYETGIRKRPNKPVLQLDACGNIIQAYLSISSAAMQLNIDGGDIGRCCKGKRKTAGGFIWKFA